VIPELVLWLQLLQDHRPGHNDEAVAEASEWEWKRLDPALDEIRRHGAPWVVLRSVALLTDVAFHVPVDERPHARAAGRALLANDGDPRGTGQLDSHLAAARRLIESLPPGRAAPDHGLWRTHVLSWYRLVTAGLLERGNLADLESHIERALERFPEEPGILFDAACFYEAYASPSVQGAIAPREEEPSHQRGETMMTRVQRSPPSLLEKAEGLFRRTLQRDPSHAESGARLGRLLLRRGRAADAVPLLEAAVRTSADDAVEYYARLHLGKAMLLTGNPADAIAQFRAATALFPTAQAAHLALSDALAESGDVGTARQTAAGVLTRTARDDVDPWAIYHHGPGRDFAGIYTDFALAMQALQQVSVNDWRKQRL
jgi:tetratricopeptide (TPR) repeat protein